MQESAYVAVIREDRPGDFLVTFPDVPEAGTQGDTFAEAAEAAHDALAAALETYLDLGRALPARSQIEPEHATPPARWVNIPVAPALAARAMLIERMRASGISKVALAQLMGRDEKAVRRIVAGKGVSLDLLLDALRAVGLRPALAA